jgi:hypothetical protein
MLKLEDLKPGLPLVGLEPSALATVAAVVPIGDGAVQVFYRTPDGTTKERLLGRADEANISIATVERPWSFDGDGAAFQLTCEAKRIELAFLFDPMMAVMQSGLKLCPKTTRAGQRSRNTKRRYSLSERAAVRHEVTFKPVLRQKSCV